MDTKTESYYEARGEVEADELDISVSYDVLVEATNHVGGKSKLFQVSI